MTRRPSELRGRRRGRRPWADEDDDPLQGFANLFDVAMVLAVALMLAVELSTATHAVAERDAASAERIRSEQAKSLKRHRVSQDQAKGKGDRLGTAYRLDSGEVVYVPEPGAQVPERQPPR